MKRTLLLALTLLLTVGARAEDLYAEGTDALLWNPRDAYEFYMEKTDGSDKIVFMMLDALNDEATLTEDGAALAVETFQVQDDGSVTFYYRTLAFQTAYGTAMREDYGTDAYAFYSVGTRACLVQDGVASNRLSIYQSGEIESLFDTLCFPPATEMALNSVREAQDGSMYYLITDGDGILYEYKTGQNNRIQEMRLYAEAAAGEFRLFLILKYDLVEAPALPDLLIRKLSEQ